MVLNLARLTTLLLLALALAWLPACGPAGAPAGGLIEGDPWDYNLRAEDVPANFEQEYFDLESGVITNRDVSLNALDPSLYQTVNAQGRQMGHFVEFSGASADSFSRVASLVVTYRTAEGAAAGLAESIPGPDPDIEWTPVEGAETVGDESTVYQMLVPDLEAVYRVDFRYRNARASVGVGGEPQHLTEPQPALDFARLMIDRMQAGAEPPQLAALRQARLADLRGLALTQEDFIELDPANGIVWYYDDNPLPQWTPERDGPVAGYQVNFYRPTGREDARSRLPYNLVVTVLGYPDAQAARAAIAGATGPRDGQRAPLEPVGEESSGWYRSGAVDFLGETELIAVYETDFRVGAYVAGVRVTAFQPAAADPLDPSDTTEFLHTFARRQAERLAAAP
jgi:hypothetical protein